MLRSLFAGISGLRSHQTMMDVTGNNIANVNTAGYKSSQVVFQDTLSQMLRAAGAPQGTTGGTNPAQVGLGVQVSGISPNFSQGAAQTTGRSTDLMIQGDGFFPVRSGNEQLYTRNGSFSFDGNGTLVTQAGAVVQGWMATGGVVNTNGGVGDIQLPIGTLLAPTVTSRATTGGNLPAGTAVGDTVSNSIPMYDGGGAKHTVRFDYTKTDANAWTLTLTENGSALGSADLTFDANGVLTSGPTMTFNPDWAAAGITVNVSGLSQYASTSTVAALDQNGSSMGSLQAFTISPDGTVVGVFSNGLKQPLGQIALASFNNPPGLEKVGGSLFRSSVNSGAAQLGVAGGAGRGELSSGALEMSNVDLAAEFTNLIIAQRGFQANSRVITASDELLQDLVNLKR
jgi:flagellar hook protein FlgE